MDELASDVLAAFHIDSSAASCSLLKRGHIHRTWLLQKPNQSEPYLVVQQLNAHVFADAELVCLNVQQVTAALNAARAPLKAAPIVLSAAGRPFYRSAKGEYFRAFEFVAESTNFEICPSAEVAGAAAKACALFHNAMLGFDFSKFTPAIAGFQDLRLRQKQFCEACALDQTGRAKQCRAEIKALEAASAVFEPFQVDLHSGRLPLRFTHADLKLNNILFQRRTLAPLCLVDLDTCMPGSVVFDFGDLARSVCLNCPEDEQDLSRVSFSIPYFKAAAESYLAHAKFLSPSETKHLPQACALVAYQLALRFIADYLNGDLYFRVSRPLQNLERARVQIKLMQAVLGELAQLRAMMKN